MMIEIAGVPEVQEGIGTGIAIGIAIGIGIEIEIEIIVIIVIIVIGTEIEIGIEIETVGDTGKITILLTPAMQDTLPLPILVAYSLHRSHVRVHAEP